MIHDARIETCAACEKRIDTNFAERMLERRETHAQEQGHLFGRCEFLRRQYYDREVHAYLFDTP